MPSTLVPLQESGRGLQLCAARDVREVIADWHSLRRSMSRNIAPEFTRDEWAYLIQFLDSHHLHSLWADAFSPRDRSSRLVLRARSPVAVWLPNNVSLLGPLVSIVLSLGGAQLLLKAGSRGDDLTAAFIDYARREMGSTALGSYLRESVELTRFDRGDSRNAEHARAAQLRIVFGEDSTVAAVDALPHPPNSIGIGFGDRQSEAWIDLQAAADDDLLRTALRVFAIYGQAGCTSPRRVVLLDGSRDDADRVRDRMVALWPTTVPGDPPAHLASENVMARQWASALGWDAVICARNAAVIASGRSGLPLIGSLRTLFVVAADEPRAVASMPENIQTIGVALAGSTLGNDAIVQLVERGVARVVPLAQMHHFGAQWDGYELVRMMFESVVVQCDP